MTEAKLKSRYPFLTFPQLIITAGVIVILVMAISVNAQTRVNEAQSRQQDRLRNVLAAETQRNQGLQATLTYVKSDEYVSDYARNEGGMLLPGEVRVVPIPHPQPLEPTPMPTRPPTLQAPREPWQAWWMLFLDSPPPGS